MRDVAAKSRALSQLFIDEVEARCGDEVRLASPRDPRKRGSHVVFAHPEGYAVMQALIARGVIGDFRAPDLMRFGFTPLYNSYAEMVRAAEILADILASREWDQPRFQTAREGYLIGAFLVRAPSMLHAPGPAAARYRKTKQNRIAASPMFAGGHRLFGKCSIQ